MKRIFMLAAAVLVSAPAFAQSGATVLTPASPVAIPTPAPTTEDLLRKAAAVCAHHRAFSVITNTMTWAPGFEKCDAVLKALNDATNARLKASEPNDKASIDDALSAATPAH